MTKKERMRVERVMAMAMRVVGNKECKGNNAMANATKIAGEWTGKATQRQW